jgi:Fur family transcriptional regulator, stress-responsive regulator
VIRLLCLVKSLDLLASRGGHCSGLDNASSGPAAALRRAGLRVTAPRLAVLTAVATGAPHSSVDAVVSAVRDHLGDGSAQTVYNVLRALTDAGLVRRIEPAGRPWLYELRVGDNHHHIVCRTCHAIADVDCAVGDTPCLTAADNSGYDIDEAEVIFWGRCPECKATNVTSGDLSATHNERGADRRD